MPRFRHASHWGAFWAIVEDGRLVSTAPFEHDPAPSEMISAWPEMVYSPLRVARPSLRKGWLAGDRGKSRGKDEFIEVGWDEALDIAGLEIDRVRKAYGNAAIFGGSYGWASAGRIHHARGLLHRFLNFAGGFTGQVTNYSYGAAMAFLPHVVGEDEAMGAMLTSFSAVAEHSDILLAFGGIPAKNWEMQSGGSGIHAYQSQMRMLADSGVEVVTISPFRGDKPEGVGSEWQPIRPNSDTALLLAMIRLLVLWDAHDREFLDRYTVGFDKLRAYLDGDSDGIEKTPQWASAITGIPAGDIEALTRRLVGRNVMLTATWSLQRARHGEQPYWALVALAAALGQIGQSGRGYTFGYGSMNGMGGKRYRTPFYGLSIGRNPVNLFIPVARVADLLLQPGDVLEFNGSTLTYPDIRLVYWAGGNPFHHHQDINRLRSAFRRPETIIVNEQYWTATARHADIVFPATTTLERNDIGGSSRDPFVLAMQKAIEPVGDARDDYDIFAALAERLDIHDAFTEGRTGEDWLRHCWERSRETLESRGLVAPCLDALFEAGYYQMPEPDEPVTQFRRFREDPDAAPLKTPSGRIELFSERVAAMGDPEQPGHPHWADPEEWLGSRRAGRHPIHLLTPQPSKRLHSQLDVGKVSSSVKRQEREILRMNLDDAAQRGISAGDIVRVFNDRGSCLAVAEPETGVFPGVALLPTGATFEADGQGGDRNSNPNVLTRDIGTSRLGQGCAAQSCLVEVARFDEKLPELHIYRPPIDRDAV